MAPSILTLPARCDRQAADELFPRLREAVASGDVAIDGSAVIQMGHAMLQLLLSARKTASVQRAALTVSMSDAMLTSLKAIGADHLFDDGTMR